VSIIKSEEEISYIERACDIADEALSHVRHILKPGTTEIEFARALEHEMEILGGEGLSFDTIVASGVNAQNIHAIPTDKQFKSGEFIMIDFGTMYKGYHSDMTRTFILGEPDELLSFRYELVLEAQMLGIKAAKPGIGSQELDAVSRDYLTAKGFGEYFTHTLGHGVGTEIHEEPFISPKKDSIIIEPGMVLTIEPGIYIPDWGGLRIEDTLLITEKSNRYLTKYPKSMVEITIL